MPKNIVIANWKMNTLVNEGVLLFQEITHLLTEANLKDTEVVICPPATHLISLDLLLDDIDENLEIYLGAQDCSASDRGAYTGDISAAQLANAGASFVIIGHSERRTMYHENNSTLLLNKIDEAMAQLMSVIYCIGESAEQRQSGQHKDVIKQQLEEVLFAYKPHDFENFIIAYEPVWAIGTGNTATPAQAQEMHHYIRSLVHKKYGEKLAKQIQIVYGGSCNANNAASLFLQPDIDGGLIGSASLLAEEFYAIILAAANTP